MMFSCYLALRLSDSHILIISCSHAIVISYCDVAIRLRIISQQRALAACYRNTGLYKSPTSARSARVRLRHVIMLLCLRALEPSCPRTLMFSWIHALVLSHCDAFSLSSPRALVKEQLGNASFYYFMCLLSHLL